MPEFSDSNTEVGGYVVDPIYMQTYTGRRFDPLIMTPDDVDLDDIAQALSLQNRYNGHTAGPISVARHSIWVMHECELAYGHDTELAFIGLMHDAAEAYIGDIIRPLKHRPQFSGYLDIEKHVEEVIAARYGFTFPHPEEIKLCDQAVTATREREDRTKWHGHWEIDRAQFLYHFARLNQGRSQ